MPAVGGVAGTVVGGAVGLPPPASTQLGSAIEGFVGQFIRGRTQHFAFQEAIDRGNVVGGEVQSVLMSAYSISDLTKVYPIYRGKMLSWLPVAATTLWGPARVQFAIDWINQNTTPNAAGSSSVGPYNIGAITHIAAIWILFNMDMTSPDEFQNTFATVLNSTLVPAFTEAGVTPPAAPATGGVTVQSGVKGMVMNMPWVWIAVAFGAVFLGWKFLRRK